MRDGSPFDPHIIPNSGGTNNQHLLLLLLLHCFCKYYYYCVWSSHPPSLFVVADWVEQSHYSSSSITSCPILSLCCRCCCCCWFRCFFGEQKKRERAREKKIQGKRVLPRRTRLLRTTASFEASPPTSPWENLTRKEIYFVYKKKSNINNKEGRRQFSSELSHRWWCWPAVATSSSFVGTTHQSRQAGASSGGESSANSPAVLLYIILYVWFLLIFPAVCCMRCTTCFYEAYFCRHWIWSCLLLWCAWYSYLGTYTAYTAAQQQ